MLDKLFPLVTLVASVLTDRVLALLYRVNTLEDVDSLDVDLRQLLLAELDAMEDALDDTAPALGPPVKAPGVCKPTPP